MCEGESSTTWSQLATQTGNLCELRLSVNHFDCCWWHAHAANHSTQSRAQHTHSPHPPKHPQQLVPQPRSLQPAAVFAARSPSTNFHIVCLQLWAYQSNSTLFIRVCTDKQTALYVYIYLFMYCSCYEEVVLTFLMFFALNLLEINIELEKYVCMNAYI